MAAMRYVNVAAKYREKVAPTENNSKSDISSDGREILTGGCNMFSGGCHIPTVARHIIGSSRHILSDD